MSLLFLFGCNQTSVEDEQVEQSSQAALNGLQINEVFTFGGSRFIELYNAGTTPVSLTPYRVATGSTTAGVNTVNTASACQLTGSLAAGAYTRIRNSCSGASNCQQCSTLSWGNPDLVNGVDGPAKRTFNLITSSNSVFESVIYPDTDGTPVQACTCTNSPLFGYQCDDSFPAIGQSWGALPNGGDCFRVVSPSPLSSN